MAGGFGSVGAMNKTIKDNRALLRGRNSLWDREVVAIKRTFVPEEQQPLSVSERNAVRERLREQQRADRLVWLWSGLLTVLLLYMLYTYGNELVRLIVHRPTPRGPG